MSLNRTSVGLKPWRSPHTPEAEGCLNRTSVGLKPNPPEPPQAEGSSASIEPAWD